MGWFYMDYFRKGVVNFVYANDPDGVKCGVAEYSANLLSALLKRGDEINVAVRNFLPRKIGDWLGVKSWFMGCEVLHYQYPLEGWGWSIVPGLVPLLKRVIGARNVRVVVTLHEWRRMHVLRRLSILPMVIFADKIIFVSKQELSAFNSSVWNSMRRNKDDSALIPIGVNVRIPEVDGKALVDFRAKCFGVESDNSLLLGFFGFIYEAKQPYKMLDIVSALAKKGVRSKLVLSGAFPDGHGEEEAKFKRYVSELGVDEFVSFMGYVEDEAELATYISASDYVLQLYDDGLSTRRGSFWYAVDCGVRIVTTKPNRPDEFEDIETFDPLHDVNIIAVDVGATAESIAEELIDRRRKWEVPAIRSCSPSWEYIADLHEVCYRDLFSHGSS